MMACLAHAGEAEPRELLCRHDPSCRLTLIARLPSAPFPYDGVVGESAQPFFDYRDAESGQRFHTTGDGVVYPEFPHYRDCRVLIHLPPGFDAEKPFDILVFFHGHHTELQRTLVQELALLRQVNASERNLVLVAPQMALDAADSSPGKLYRPQGFANLLGEVSQVLREEEGEELADRFDQAPLLLAAYSGGFRAVAHTLERWVEQERNERLRGVILLDALYGELEKFDGWLRPAGGRFFVNLYGPSSAPLSQELEQKLWVRGQPWSNSVLGGISSEGIYSLAVGTSHESLFLTGPPRWPLAVILNKIED